MQGFVQEAIRNFNVTGAITPSSRLLERKMLKPIDFDDAGVIVEFGAGSGVFTRALLSKMQHDARLISCEINPHFYGQLKSIEDPRLLLVNQCVAELKHVLNQNFIQQVDYIVSGLPLALFNKRFVREVLETAYTALKPGGTYIQYQYSVKSLKTLKKHFGDVKVDFTPFNLPPAFIYTCVKEKGLQPKLYKAAG